MVKELDLLVSIDEFGPEKIICVSDSKTGMKGVLVIDNTARGMGKGGCRMSPHVTTTEICQLARVMTWKWAMADLNFGGAKAGIRADPGAANKEEQVRSFARALRDYIPQKYVFGLDMGLDEYDAALVLDELEDMRAAVGTPECLGGVPYDQWGVTGYGVAECTRLVADILQHKLADMTVAIQGFGAVGYAAARFLHKKGAKITAVSNIDGVIVARSGLDIKRLLDLYQQHGQKAIIAYGGGLHPLGTELNQDVDILILAATQSVITGDNVAGVKARVIIEGANLPVTSDAEQELLARKTIIIPDFLANNGGIIAAALAMGSRNYARPIQPQDIYNLIDEKMKVNIPLVLERARHENMPTRAIALRIAKDRVRQAMALKAGKRR